MAPEVLQSRCQSTKIDIWALGVLLYEMTHGCAPFNGKNLRSVKEKINEGRIKFKNVSNECQELIKRILRIRPEERPEIEEI